MIVPVIEQDGIAAYNQLVVNKLKAIMTINDRMAES
jgi:hypothetical protein